MPLPTMSITPSGGSPSTWSGPIPGFCFAAGQYYIMPGEADDGDFALELVPAPNVAGQATIRQQFKELHIDNVIVCYVASTPDLCIAAYRTDVDNIKGQNCSVSIPNDGNSPYPSCEVIRFKPWGRPKDTGGGTYMLRCTMTITQYRQE